MAYPMTATVEGAAGALTPTQVAAVLIDLTFKQSQVLQTLLKDSKHNLLINKNDIDVPVLSSGVGGGWLASEGAEKPKSTMSFTKLNIELVEVAVMVPISDRFVEDSNIPMGALVRQEITREFARLIDTAILSNGAAIGWGSDFNTAATAASNTFNGASYDDFGLLVSAMIGTLETSNAAYDRSAFALYFAPNVWQVLRDARTSNGQPLFLLNPTTETGVVGTVYGIPVFEVAANKFPSGVDMFLVDRSVVHVAQRNAGFDIRNLGGVTYTDSVGNLRSAAEHDEEVYRGTHRIGMNISNNEGVALASGVELAV